MKRNDKVQVHLDGRWRDAILLSVKERPTRYGVTVEWHYQFDPCPQFDPVTWISPSTGGWADQRYFRSRP